MAAYLVEVYVPLLSEDTEADLAQWYELLGKRVFAKYGRVTVRQEDVYHGFDAADVCSIIRAYVPDFDLQHQQWWETEIRDAWNNAVGAHRSFQVLGWPVNAI